MTRQPEDNCEDERGLSVFACCPECGGAVYIKHFWPEYLGKCPHCGWLNTQRAMRDAEKLRKQAVRKANQ